MKILGIDNGLNGALGWLDFELNTAVAYVEDVHVYDVFKGRKRNKKGIMEDRFKKCYNIRFMAERLKEINPDLTIIEHAQAYPGQGGVSNFSTGFGHGLYLGILNALKLSYQIVTVQSWHKEFGISKRGHGGDPKGQSFKIASALFPDLELSTPRGRILDGRCDAILMAEYGRRKSLQSCALEHQTKSLLQQEKN